MFSYILKINFVFFSYSNNRKANVADEDALWKELRHQHIADVTKQVLLFLKY